jgi:hypothetical protein
MKQILASVHQVNTWTAIASLALIGWLIDSLLWFLEGHSLTLAGFMTYLAHSWYALPLLVAIIIILRLRRPSELLSLTIYDERGVPVYHQGDFRLEESALEPIITSYRGSSQDNGLHHIELPTGSAVYFLHQRGLTMVACFSGPARPTQLKAGLHLLVEHEVPTEALLRDLPLDVATLAATLLNAPVERDLLIHLWQLRRTSMQVIAWAGLVGYTPEEVTAAIGNLAKLALVQRQDVCGMTFYRLTDDKTYLARLDQFITWRTDWLARASGRATGWIDNLRKKFRILQKRITPASEAHFEPKLAGPGFVTK